MEQKKANDVRPPMDELLNPVSAAAQDPELKKELEQDKERLRSVLANFGVQAKLTSVTHGPSVTRYELQPGPGVPVHRIVELEDAIRYCLSADSVRFEPTPGKPAVSIEIFKNRKGKETVSLRSVLESPEMQQKDSLTAFALGRDASGKAIVADLARLPHLLIAGGEKKERTACIHAMINSFLLRAKPDEVGLILIEPEGSRTDASADAGIKDKLDVYQDIPHLLVPVIHSAREGLLALEWAEQEMERRYERLRRAGARNVKEFNIAKAGMPDEEPMNRIVIIVDDLADLMGIYSEETGKFVSRLAQSGRTAGIHLVLVTGEPEADVLTGIIRANIPSRIAFSVSSAAQSIRILDKRGAEKLRGAGDMLFMQAYEEGLARVQGCLITAEETGRVCDWLCRQYPAACSEATIREMESIARKKEEPDDSIERDETLIQAIELAIEYGRVSVALLQRRLRVGYARAERLIAQMVELGVIAEKKSLFKPNETLISMEDWQRMQENQE